MQRWKRKKNEIQIHTGNTSYSDVEGIILLGFIIGFMMGGLFGVFTIALATAAREDRDDDWFNRRRD